MNAKAMCLGGSVLLVGALLLWSCDSDTTGGLGSPCGSSGECGSGLICAVGRCSDRRYNRPCETNDQCIPALVCDIDRCGGIDGDPCRGDANCIPGLICARVAQNNNAGDFICTPRGDGGIGSLCGNHGHCNTQLGFLCDRDRGLCTMPVRGSLGSSCDDDSPCDLPLVCINSICNNKSGEGGACSNNDHCLGSLVCDIDTCRRPAGTGCGNDSQCVGDLICAGYLFPVCSMSDGAAGSVCGIDDHCGGLSCVLGACSVGNAGSRCLTSDDCTGFLVCGNNVCGGAVGSSCSDDTDCGVDLVCNGAPGNKVCGQPGGGSADSVCGVNSHCNDGLSCVLGMCSDRSAGSRCEFDLHCADSLICGNGICGLDVRSLCSTDEACAGSLICAGPTGGVLRCAQSNGLLGNACGLDTHCTGSLCLSGVCKIAELGERCNSDNPYCTAGLVCSGSGESSECRVARGGVCVADGDCVNTDVNSNVCQFGQNAQPRVCTPLDPRIGGVCRSDDQCTGAGVICIGDTGRQICAQRGDGSTGSVCNSDDHCDPGLICHNNACAAVGTKWTSRESNVSGELRDVHYDNNLWVAVGDNQNDMGNVTSGAVTTSMDGTGWTSEITIETNTTNAAHYGNGRWVSVSDDGSIASRRTNNGGNISWVSNINHIGTMLRDLHYANNRWVIVGRHEGRNSGAVTGYIVQEGRGTDFDDTTLGGILTHELHAVHYDNNLWVAVGDGGLIATSTSGTMWTSGGSDAARGRLLDVYYGNGLWVAASGDGNIITSTDGTAWTSRAITDNGMAITNIIGITDIHYANSVWVAAGLEAVSGVNSGLIATSSDGTMWVKRTSNASDMLNAVHYADNLWVAVGNGGVIVTGSADGATWAAVEESNVTSNLTDIYYGNSRWVAVGADGDITTSRTR